MELYSGEERSEQPLKLFVGQVPKDMDEDQLRPLFEQAGPIAHIMVIRDRQTEAHRGCAFLTYETREAGERAVEKFHNKVKLPNAHNPVQVRPADSQMGDDRPGPSARVAPIDRENKLFVGMLPHDADDVTLKDVFSRFGEITEIYCMRNPDGTPKGCAFVKFATRAAAIDAIEALHEKCTMEGATRALVVKFADVKKTHPTRGLGRVLPSPLGNGLGHLGENPADNWPAMPAAYGNIFPSLRDPSYAGYPPQGGYPAPRVTAPYPAPSYEHHQPHHRGQGGYIPFAHSPPYPPFGQQGERPLSPPATAGERVQPSNSPQGGPISSGRDHMRENGEQAGGTRPQEGPPGANLFIYHLPNDLTDADLATAFAPFGNVISAKVFLDKRTGESKGFGFVSYDRPSHAEVAITKMNGFQIGSKRLKVQHKKGDIRYPDRFLGRYPDRDQDRDGLRYAGHHGSNRGDMHSAPLHGGSGRLGMGYGHRTNSSSPNIRSYPPAGDIRMIQSSNDSRVVYSTSLPPSYDGGVIDDAPSVGPYTHRSKSMSHAGVRSSTLGLSSGGPGAATGVERIGGVDPGVGTPGGGLYHAESH